jgi:predicted transcriptional regulator
MTSKVTEMPEIEVQGTETGLVPITAQVVAAFLQHNQVALSELKSVIECVYRALRETQRMREAAAPVPALPIKKSVRKNSIFCLECGAEFKAIRRHLRTAHGLTPDAYREKWKLAPDYPLVAPEYAALRSRMAKEIGLGKRAAALSAAPTVIARKSSSRKRKTKKGA